MTTSTIFKGRIKIKAHIWQIKSNRKFLEILPCSPSFFRKREAVTVSIGTGTQQMLNECQLAFREQNTCHGLLLTANYWNRKLGPTKPGCKLSPHILQSYVNSGLATTISFTQLQLRQEVIQIRKSLRFLTLQIQCKLQTSLQRHVPKYTYNQTSMLGGSRTPKLHTQMIILPSSQGWQQAILVFLIPIYIF